MGEEEPLDRLPSQSKFVTLLAGIRESFGEEIAQEAESILNEPGADQLPWLKLVALAEERFFERRFGGLANERLNSHIEMLTKSEVVAKANGDSEKDVSH